MTVIIAKDEIKDYFFLRHAMKDFDQYEWMDYDLPTPTHTDFQSISYAINGFFGTQSSKKYVDDMSSRFCKTFAKHTPFRLFNKPIDEKGKWAYVAYDLKSLQALKSLKEESKDDAWRNVVVQRLTSTDALFDAVRFSIYDYVKRNGKEALSLEYVEYIAQAHNHTLKKSYSDVRCKSKAVYFWVMEFYNPTGKYCEMSNEEKAIYIKKYRMKKGITKMSREDHIKQVHDNRKNETIALLKGAIAQLTHLKKKVNISSVSELAKISRPTVTKHREELGL